MKNKMCCTKGKPCYSTIRIWAISVAQKRTCANFVKHTQPFFKELFSLISFFSQDLLRQDSADLTTILEIEINNQFLKDGLRIIIPPDIATDPGNSNHLELKKLHSELYSKRSSILQNFHPVYLYAVDRVGKNVFCDNICGNMVVSRSDEDFWSSFNLYNVNKNESKEVEVGRGDRAAWTEGRGEPAVFSSEVSITVLL